MVKWYVLCTKGGYSQKGILTKLIQPSSKPAPQKDSYSLLKLNGHLDTWIFQQAFILHDDGKNNLKKEKGTRLQFIDVRIDV